MLLEGGVDVLVVGGGISGCAAARELQQWGARYLLLEANADLGGLSRSISVGPGHFDYTGHFLHLARFPTPAAIPHANLSDDDWQQVLRRSYVYVHGTLVPAPFQYNLAYLPEPVRERCIDSFRNRRVIENPHSLHELLISGFGVELCREFFLPYSQKQQAISLHRLAAAVSRRFFPGPDPNKIEEGYARRNVDAPLGYNSRFWYPKREGIGLLARGLAHGLQRVHTSCPLLSIDLKAHRAVTPLGTTVYESAVSSIPLKHLCMLTGDPYLCELADGLSHNRVASVNLLAEGPLPEAFREAHWLYIPDPAIPVYRVGFYSNVIPRASPPGHVAVYAEIAYPMGPAGPIAEPVEMAYQSLTAMGLLGARAVRVIAANWIDCAYVHFLADTAQRVTLIRERLEEHNIFTVGRYGRWDYISMEDSLIDGVSLAKGLIGTV